ncbi:MAG: NADPH-dependent FMN reductase [Vicingaceae bacterium]
MAQQPMKNILAFAGSNSKNSINKQLAVYAAGLLSEAKIIVVDLNDFPLPMYSIDLENNSGIPEQAHKFKEFIDQSDGIVLSLAEHNGSFTAAYKNTYDWVSRIDKNVFQHKPLFLLATSPGGRGASSVLEHASSIYSHSNKAPLVNYSLPSFHKNFDADKGIIDKELQSMFEKKLNLFKQILGLKSKMDDQGK